MTIDANLIEGVKIGFGVGFLLALIVGFCLGALVYPLIVKEKKG